MFPTTYDTETELSAVNSILGSIGQSPVTELDFENPEIATIYRILMEAAVDIQGEGWVFNREQNYRLTPDVNKHIVIPENILRMDISDGQVWRTTDVVKRQGKLYDKIKHSYEFDRPVDLDIVWEFPYIDLPTVFKRYATVKASTRAATQLVGNPQLTQLLATNEAFARASCLEYECNQGDYSFFGNPSGTAYRSFQPYQALQR